MKKSLIVIWILLISIACKVEKPTGQYSNNVEDPGDTTVIEMNDLPAVQSNLEYQETNTRLIDLLHTKLEINLDWELQQLNGIATLQIRPYFYAQDKVVLDAKNFEIHDVKLVAGSEKSDLNYFYDGLELLITLDTVYSREQAFFIEIAYTAKPTERIVSGSEAIESDQGLYFINHDGSNKYKPTQAWTQGETEANSYWFPTVDSPNERTTQEIYITVDQKYTTLSNGELVYSKFNTDSTRTDYWKLDQSHAPYLFMFAVGEFEIYEDSWEGMEVTYYMEPRYAPYARDVFGETPAMLTFFSDLYGLKYVWPKYAQIVVRDYVSGAMENTTASLFYEDLNVDSRDLIDYNYEKIIAHELAHQWFGDLVTCESWSNLTLNEGFANYAEYLWYNHKYGIYEAEMHSMDELDQYLEESTEKQVDLIRYYYDDKEDMFDSHSYAKGGLILNMLRDYVGDDAFFESLKRYLVKYSYSSAEVHDLRLTFEEVTGEDLNWFFNQWYLASGHPILNVEQQYEDSVLQISVSQMQDISKSPTYNLPLYIDIWSEGETSRFFVEVDDVSQVFEFTFPQKPDLVLFDASQSLVGEIKHDKTIEEYVYQYYNVDHFKAKYIALNTILSFDNDSLKHKVLIDALDDPFWYFRQMAINALEDLDGIERQVIEKKLNELAQHDPKSLVRADALHALYTLNPSAYKEVIEKALNDSSYMVVGTAIYAYTEIDPAAFKKIVSKYETYDNINIVIPLASFFIDQVYTDKYDWFVEKLNRSQADGLWYLIQYFGEYMMNAPEEMQRNSILIFEEFARDHNKNYIRLAAYQALGLLSDLSGVDDLRLDIKNNEDDAYLRSLYQSLF